MNSKIARYVALAAAALMMAGCNDIVDYDEGYTPLESQANTGAPEITAVYDVGDTELESPITEAQPGQMVRIVGKNLNNAQRVTFNTVEADLSQAYTYSTSANVTVPTRMELNGDGKIVYTTDKGSCEYQFTIPFPELEVDGLRCEFMDAGDVVTVTGQNFDYYDFGASSTVTLAGNPLEIASVSNGEMQVRIPEGTPDNSLIELAWTSGTSGERRTASLPFRPTRNLLYGDLSDVSVETSNLAASVETDADVTTDASQLGNPHFHVTAQWSAWSWNELTLSRNLVDIDGQNIGLLDREALKDYVLKFEIMNATNHPLPGDLTLQLRFNWDGEGTWQPGDGEGLNTAGTWQTVSLPLYDMVANGFYGSEDSRWTALNIAFQPGSDVTADFRLGNFRIEKK